MRIRHHSLLLGAALAAGVLALPAAAFGQARVMPNYSGVQPVSAAVGTLQKSAIAGASRAMVNPAAYYGGRGGTTVVAPGGYGGGYYGPYSGDYSLGNTMQGAASVINAQGQFNIQNQQAKLAQQQVEQAKVDTKRKQFDEYMYEKANTPTVNDIREAQMNADLRRQRNDPPPSEIWSGEAINGLLKTVQREQAQLGIQGPAIPLDQALLQKVNLSSGTSGAGIGALKGTGGGELAWPLALEKDVFKAEHMKIDGLADQLVRQASTGKVMPKTLQQLIDSVNGLKAKVKDQIDEMTPTENVKANRFCNELLAAARSLEDPAAVNHFNGQWSLSAGTMPELVDQMSKKGLTFAPAASGQETAYTAMYRALADYDTALGQMTARLQSPGPAPKTP
jgi:hypothetical protein